MNCFNHPETQAVAFCRECGKALCEECKRPSQGTVFCADHVPAAVPPAYGTAPVAYDVSPGLACFLGFIPGVGAIYNGQYAKGLVHAIIFGLLVSITGSGAAAGLEPLFGILITAWIFYMAFEAYHTALKRRRGEPVDEFSSLINLRGTTGRFPIGAIVLIVLGFVLLMNTLDILDFRYLLRYWPVILILIGAYMLYTRLSGPGSAVTEQEVHHEQQ